MQNSEMWIFAWYVYYLVSVLHEIQNKGIHLLRVFHFNKLVIHVHQEMLIYYSYLTRKILTPLFFMYPWDSTPLPHPIIFLMLWLKSHLFKIYYAKPASFLRKLKLVYYYLPSNVVIWGCALMELHNAEVSLSMTVTYKIKL